MEKNHYQKRIHETKTKIDFIVISQLLSLSTEPIFSSKKETNLQKKTSLIQIWLKVLENFLEESLKKRSHFFCRVPGDP
jgi:hypothetical protein